MFFFFKLFQTYVFDTNKKRTHLLKLTTSRQTYLDAVFLKIPLKNRYLLVNLNKKFDSCNCF